MPCYCSLIRAYERDIAKLEEAYRINERKNGTNDALESQIQTIKSRECAAYEANNIEEIEAAVDKLDDELRPARDRLGAAIMSKIGEARQKKADYHRRDRDHHERERLSRMQSQSEGEGA